MSDDSNKELIDEEMTTDILDITMAAIIYLIDEIEGYTIQYPKKSKDEVLELIRSKEWIYVSKKPEFLTWRDWFVMIAVNRIIQCLKWRRDKITEEQIKHVENLIYETMDDFENQKSRGKYNIYRIGFRKFES